MMTSNDPRSEAELGETYDPRFYESLAATVRDSAAVIAPIVIELIGPRSILDVGCGRGTWLGAFRSRGVKDVVGVDGSHVGANDLEIPRDSFVAHDLLQPLKLGRRFDLTISLEVAEHLPPEIAPTFVAALVAHAPVVLFSAAIPRQGGAGHVNEQWPSYWCALFAQHHYVPVDVIRPAVWTDERVAFWYAQNTMLYVDPNARADVVARACDPVPPPLDLVHPGLYLRPPARPSRNDAPSLRGVARELPGAAARAVRRRVRPRGGKQ
jgi:SAM-dependent methyltransferase